MSPAKSLACVVVIGLAFFAAGLIIGANLFQP